MGNVCGTAAEIFYKNGQKVVAVSDYTGGLYCEDGLDIPAIRKFISEGNTLDKYEAEGVSHVTNDGLITCKCDVLIPGCPGEPDHRRQRRTHPGQTHYRGSQWTDFC